MARIRKQVPSYLKHSQSGLARAVWTDASGIRRFMMLPGRFNSPESLTAFARLQLELATSPIRASLPHQQVVSVNELLLGYLKHAERYYRTPEGNQTGETQHVKVVARHIREAYGMIPVTDFGPLALKAVRQQFIEKGWCRKTINQQVDRIRRAFRWGVAEELVPPAVYEKLMAVERLMMGRTEAPDYEKIRPVNKDVVEATLPYLNRHVRGLVEFQLLTACRPGEACNLRRSEIEIEGEAWSYKPKQHKNSHRGKARIIPIGPKCQKLLREFPYFRSQLQAEGLRCAYEQVFMVGVVPSPLAYPDEAESRK